MTLKGQAHVECLLCPQNNGKSSYSMNKQKQGLETLNNEVPRAQEPSANMTGTCL